VSGDSLQVLRVPRPFELARLSAAPAADRDVNTPIPAVTSTLGSVEFAFPRLAWRPPINHDDNVDKAQVAAAACACRNRI
jgi:hypothetical protein